MQANVNRYLAAAKKLGVKAKAGKIDDEVAEVYVDAGPASEEMKLLNDLQRDMLQATGYFGGDERLRKESIVMQPMLENTTAVYLTEQKDRDNRFKSTIIEEEVTEEAIAGIAAAAGRGLAAAGKGVARVAKSEAAKKIARGVGKVAKKGLKVGAGVATGALGGAAEGTLDVAKGAVKGVTKTVKGAIEGGLEAAVGDEESNNKVATPEEAAKYSDEEDKDFRDEQRDQDPLRHSGDLKKLTYSVGSVGGQHGQIMSTDNTFDSLEDACNHAGVDVQDCISGVWDDMGDGTKEYGVDEDTVIIMHVGKAENEERINEAIEMQPHLEVSETSTAAYLTEQKQSDKRNKKAEVKNQTFKDRYKPKTHWQLEELKRYGL